MLQACDARPRSQVVGQSILAELIKEEGPEVTGVSDALLTSAKQAESSKDYARAAQFYRQLVDQKPGMTEYHVKLANNLRRVPSYEPALEAYNRVLSQDPNNVEALEGKGLTLISQTDFANASMPLERVMKITPNRWRTLNGIGILFIAKGMPNEALAYFDAALAQKPEHAPVLNNIGLTLALKEEFPRAFEVLNRASGRVASKSLERQRIDLNLALILGISGDLKRAENIASKHLQDAALENNLGFYAHLANNNGLAKAYLNSALSGSTTFYEKAWENLEQVN